MTATGSISAPEFGFYKASGSWTKHDPRPAAATLAGGWRLAGGGAGGETGGGAGGEPQNTRTLPLINGGSTIRKQAVGCCLFQRDGNTGRPNLYFLEAIER